MDINEYRTRLKNGKLSGIYVFAGEEEYLIKHYLAELRAAVGVEEAFAVFNNPIFDGSEVDFAAIAEAVKVPPMMSDYKLIEWRHADFSAMKEKDLDALEELIALVAEQGYAAVALTAASDSLDFGTPKRPSAFIKRFGASAAVLRFERSTDNQLYGWLKKHFDAEGVGVTLDVLRELVFRSGHSMEVLSLEVKKLSALAKARGKAAVTPADVAEVASTTPESDTFAFSNALTERSRTAAYAALEELRFRRVDPTVVMGMMIKVFDDLLAVAMLLEQGSDVKDVEGILKINPYKLKIYVSAVKRYSAQRLREITDALTRADADSKFGGINGYLLIELFISRYV